ncbi:equilibrative nucleoside transporter 2 isoform X2 [Bombina bombina]|uniref:equilibrative nucleoside transporter 2 isoform X2 n=1 Tax=Bombina bombina TaxID=8345 RepID=UPI00235AE6FA|nr:equilibrative nucleoside transporter 2 isoform X2 [Bombina bombina]
MLFVDECLCPSRHWGLGRQLGILSDPLHSLLRLSHKQLQSTFSNMSRKDGPEDKYHGVGIIFFILGLGTLLPWNFFITAIPYFQYRLKTVEPEERFLIINDSDVRSASLNISEVQIEDKFNFNNWMTLLAQLPLLLCTLLNSFLYQCIPDKVRITGSMFAILGLFMITAILVKVEMSAQSFFDVTMTTIWFINAFCAILQGSLFGLLGLFPQNYSSLFLSGQGMAGTFAALAMLLSMSMLQ